MTINQLKLTQLPSFQLFDGDTREQMLAMDESALDLLYNFLSAGELELDQKMKKFEMLTANAEKDFTAFYKEKLDEIEQKTNAQDLNVIEAQLNQQIP